ncbi:MAG: hypothetical protein JAY67_12565, partial [Candidatus Thiodiazotropha taylori]|nr:hypothetical protein [Candidatus Thiodiazotropha taylori]
MTKHLLDLPDICPIPEHFSCCSCSGHIGKQARLISQHAPPILDRLQLDAKQWLYMTQNFESRFKGLVGASHSLKAA